MLPVTLQFPFGVQLINFNDEARRAELIHFDSPYLVLIRIDIKSGVSFHNSCRHVMSEK